jgi:alkylation response protein AidB-like acyl-CoA dehydrogenase
MEIGYTEEQEALRDQLREYYADLLTPEVEEQLVESHGIGPNMRRVVKQMAADGWLGIGWPTEYGGQGRSALEQYIFFDESMRAGAPVPMLTINTVGPTIMDFGTPEQKEFFLPKILAGEIHFCIGYTEPESGTDLASLQTRAVRDGDEYVINGQKIYTSLAGGADYIWLATRTDPEVAKHKGISMFIVPMDTPGIKVVPMSLLGDHNINYTFYEDVRVPAGNRPAIWSGARTTVGRSSPTSSITSGSPCAHRGSSSGPCPTSGPGPRTPNWPTAGGSSTRSGCRCTWPGSTPGWNSSS